MGSVKQVASACKSSITWKEIIKGTWNYECYNLRHLQEQEVPEEANHQPQTHPKNNHQLLKTHVLHVCWVLCQKVTPTAGGESRLVKPNIKNSEDNRQQKHGQRNWLIQENLNAEKKVLELEHHLVLHPDTWLRSLGLSTAENITSWIGTWESSFLWNIHHRLTNFTLRMGTILVSKIRVR